MVTGVLVAHAQTGDAVDDPLASPRIDLGSWLKRKRLSQRKSARQISAEGGLSPSYVGKVEKGEIKDPTLRNFARLVYALDLSPREVYFLVLNETKDR